MTSLKDLLKELSPLIDRVEDEQLNADLGSWYMDLESAIEELTDLKRKAEMVYDELSSATY